jgi:hypothetical protein
MGLLDLWKHLAWGGQNARKDHQQHSDVFIKRSQQQEQVQS